MERIIKKVCGWAILWYTSYKLVKRFNSEKCPEYSCRIITEIHALIITVATFYILFLSGTWPFDVLGLDNTHEQVETMCASLGYFIYDFMWCLYYMTEGPVMLLHHFISIVTMSVSLWMRVSGTEVLGTIFGSEISSIFLNLRWFLKYYNLSESGVGMATDITFVLLFFSVRIMLGGFLAYSELLSPAPFLMKLGGMSMYFVNCVFLVHIMSFARYKIKKHSNKKKTSETNGHSISESTQKNKPGENEVRHLNGLQKHVTEKTKIS